MAKNKKAQAIDQHTDPLYRSLTVYLQTLSLFITYVNGSKRLSIVQKALLKEGRIADLTDSFEHVIADAKRLDQDLQLQRRMVRLWRRKGAAPPEARLRALLQSLPTRGVH